MRRLMCILTVLFILTSYPSFAQYWLKKLNKDREQIAGSFYLKKAIVTKTDSTLIFQVDSTKFSPSKKTFHFDQNGKCDWIVSTFDCEKCYLADLTPIITSKHCRWVQLDSLTYVTNKLKAELHTRYQKKPYSYILKRTDN